MGKIKRNLRQKAAMTEQEADRQTNTKRLENVLFHRENKLVTAARRKQR